MRRIRRGNATSVNVLEVIVQGAKYWSPRDIQTIQIGSLALRRRPNAVPKFSGVIILYKTDAHIEPEHTPMRIRIIRRNKRYQIWTCM